MYALKKSFTSFNNVLYTVKFFNQTQIVTIKWIYIMFALLRWSAYYIFLCTSTIKAKEGNDI